MCNQVDSQTSPPRVHVYSLLLPFPLAFVWTLVIAHPLGDYAALLALIVGVVAQIAAIWMTLRRSSRPEVRSNSDSLGP